MTPPSAKAEAAKGAECRLDWAIGGLLFAAYLGWLLCTTRDLGYARDEGFYFQAAESYRQWFALLVSDPSRAMAQASVDRYWRINHEHPALIKALFAASKSWLSDVGLPDGGTVYRFPGMVLSSLAVAVTYAWGRVSLNRGGALFAALAFAWMPRVFYHSHLACFDMPVVCVLLLTTYAYFRSLHERGWRWVGATALLYGLALNTKHNAWVLPVALVAHWVLRALLGGRTRGGRTRWRIPVALPTMLVVGPALLYLGWPWIWRDTFRRLTEYVTFHTQHVYYNMEFLGTTYFEPPMPLGYAWVMTLSTVPGVTIVLACLGLVAALVACWRRVQAVRGAVGDSTENNALSIQLDASILWLMSLGVAYGPWVLSGTPIFGGTKHWMTAYPFAALFAGQGFSWLTTQLASASRSWPPGVRSVGQWALGFALLVGSFSMTADSHPWGLSAYTPLVGGAPGAASLGLNRSFWGYTTGAVQERLSQLGDGKKVFVHDTAGQSFRQMQRDGRLGRRLRPVGRVSDSDVALYHHEQHMSRVEHMIWTDYGTTSPEHVGMHDGVPVVWIYAR